MPKVTIWIRNEDYDKWKAIDNVPAQLHQWLNPEGLTSEYLDSQFESLEKIINDETDVKSFQESFTFSDGILDLSIIEDIDLQKAIDITGKFIHGLKKIIINKKQADTVFGIPDYKKEIQKGIREWCRWSTFRGFPLVIKEEKK